MKKGAIFLLFTFLLFSCSSDDNENQEENHLIGSWKPAYRIEYYSNIKDKEDTFENKIMMNEDKSPIIVFESNGKAYKVKVDNAGFEEENSKESFIWWSENNKYNFEGKQFSFSSMKLENNYLVIEDLWTNDFIDEKQYIKGVTFYYTKASNNYKPKE